MTKKKVIQIITRLDKGGSAENVLLTCEYLTNRSRSLKVGYDIVLIYGGEKQNEINDSRILKVGYQDYYLNHSSFTVYHLSSLVRNVSLFKDLIAFWQIYKIIKKEKPDIVHTHTSKAGILGRWATFVYNCRLLRQKSEIINPEPSIINHKSKIKIIHTPHGHIFYGYYGRVMTAIFIMIEKITAMITDKLVALTEGEKEESLKFGIGKKEQWTVVPSGIDFNFQFSITNYQLRKELNISDNAIVIGTVARLEPVKGIKYFIEAIPLIFNLFTFSRFHVLTFIIVGDGSEKKSLEFRVEGLGIKDKVIFTGMKENVTELISIMDIYVQPSLNEGMGKTLVMASMLEKPIIATKVQGIPDVVKDGETGILVEPKDSRNLAQSIIQLINNKELRKKLGENGKRFVNEIVDGYPRFSVDRMIFLLDKLYENIY